MYLFILISANIQPDWVTATPVVIRYCVDPKILVPYTNNVCTHCSSKEFLLTNSQSRGTLIRLLFGCHVVLVSTHLRHSCDQTANNKSSLQNWIILAPKLGIKPKGIVSVFLVSGRKKTTVGDAEWQNRTVHVWKQGECKWKNSVTRKSHAGNALKAIESSTLVPSFQTHTPVVS